MSNLTQTQKVILALTSASLFGKQVNIPADIDWWKVLEECGYQSVLVQVFATAQPHLPEEIRKKWGMLCNRIIAKNTRVEWEHFELHKIMSQGNIPYVVMKGSASSMYYPDPSLRMMGDVDFLVSTENLQKADELIVRAGFDRQETDEEKIHIAYHRSGVAVRSIWEMHWRANGIPDTEVGAQIQRYMATAVDEAVLAETSEGAFMGPSRFHHGLIMLLHTATHMINTGIGLRHLCDWAVFAASLSDEEFCDTFQEKLKKIGLWQFAQLLTQLSVAYLGCPERVWAGSGDPNLMQAMIEDVFAGGNFGRKDEQRINQAKLITNSGKAKVDETSLLRQFVYTMNEKARSGFPASARFPVLLPIGWFYVGVRHILRIMTGRRPKIDINEMIFGANKRKSIYKKFKLFEEE